MLRAGSRLGSVVRGTRPLHRRLPDSQRRLLNSVTQQTPIGVIGIGNVGK